MKRLRTALKFGLAGGVAMSALAISLPQLLNSAKVTSANVNADVDSAAVTRSVEAAALTSATEPGPAIAHFLGIAQFLKNPTQYGLLCGLACDDANTAAQGEVVSASLQGDRLEIEYRYLTNGIAKTGRLTGKLNSDGVFKGIYRTHPKIAEHTAKQANPDGDITFTFAADGTAQGNYDKGKGPAGIIL